MYITIEGKELQLTWQQEHEIRDQIRKQDAVDMLLCYEYTNEDIGLIPEEVLDDFAMDLEERIYDGNGDIEYAVLEDYIQRGLIKQLD